MPLTHEIDGRILVIHQHDETDPAAIHRGMQAALQDPRLQASSHLLWNAVEAPARASADKIQLLLSGLRGLGSALSGRCAMVVSNRLQYGVSRMLSVYAQDVNLQVEVFYDQQSARRWLESDAPSAGAQDALSASSV